MSIEKAKELKEAGKSVREIATELGISKSTASRWTKNVVEKSWLNPRWTVIGGDNHGPVDVFGAIPEPEMADLLSLMEDSVYISTNWIANTIASVNSHLYVKTAVGQQQPKCLTAPIKKSELSHLANYDVQEVLDHSLKSLLEHPNPDQNGRVLVKSIDIDLSLCGNAFVRKIRADDGLPEQLWSLQPDKMKLAWDEKGVLVGFWYSPQSFPIFIPKKDVIWFKFEDPRNRLSWGVGPVRGVYERVLQNKDELAYVASLYRNQARPDSIITIKDILAPEAERVQKEWNMRLKQGGIGGVIVTNGEEMDVKPLSWSPKDLLGQEVRTWTKLQILNAFGLNAALFENDGNRSLIEGAEYMALKNAVLPRLRLIEAQINHDLIPEFDERLLFVFDNPCTDDADRKAQENVSLLDRGVLTINEVRHGMGLNPVEWGNTPYQSNNGSGAAMPAK